MAIESAQTLTRAANSPPRAAPLSLPTREECKKNLEVARQRDPRLDKLLTLCAKGILDERGVPTQLQPIGVSIEVGALIYWLTARYTPRDTIDTGFGYGVAASFFALAHRHTPGYPPSHYSVDAHLGWTNGVGTKLIEELGLKSIIHLEEELAHIGLANVYSRNGPGQVAVALMDGSNLFDELIADYLCIERLFKWNEAGLLLICRPHLPQIRAFISFLETNRKFEISNWSHELAVACCPSQDRIWFHFEPFAVPLESHVVPLDGDIVEMPAPDGLPLAFANELGHQYYLRRVLHGREYPPLFPDVFQPTTILDVGAHVGTAARFFSNLYPNARIVCIEPTPESFALLGRNTAHLPMVERHQVAFAKRSGPIRIWRGQHSSGQSSALPNEANSESFFEASGMEPLRFCVEHNLAEISILKVDIEGLEMDVLRALQPLLPKIQVLYIEYHSEALRREIDTLLAAGFTLFSSEATEAFCGTVCYAATALLADLMAKTSAPRFTFAK
jgi:FkbM family methyltransferase